MYYKLGRAGRALDRFGVIEFATTIAPGVRDVLLTGKVFEAVQRNSRNKGAIAVRRRGARRAADRPDHPVPQRQRRAGRAGEGRPDQAPGRHDDDVCSARRGPPSTWSPLLEEMPVQETADGIDQLRAAGLPGRAASSSTWSGRATCRSRTWRRRARAARPGSGRARTSRPPASRWTTPCVDGLLDEARDHAVRRALEDSQRKLDQGPRRPDLRAAAARAAASISGGSTSWRRRSREQGLGMTRTHPRVGPLAARGSTAPALDVDALLDDPAHRDHRLLRLRRRRQDHHLGRAGAARRRARPQGRRADHRPGPAAGAVDGDRGARQHPAAGGRVGRRLRRVARRDDARHEADLRRGRGEPGLAGEGETDPGEPLLHRTVELFRRARRSTWRWRSSASSSATPGRPAATT